MDFQPLLDAALPGPVNMPTEAEVVAGWPPVGPPVALAALDLATFDGRVGARLRRPRPSTSRAPSTPSPSRSAPRLHGAIEHTLDPWTWPTSSWATSVWVLPDPLHVGAGAVLRVHYSRRVPGSPDGLTCELVESAR